MEDTICEFFKILGKIVSDVSISDGVWVVVGFLLGLLPPIWDRRRQRDGCKESLKAEICHCGEMVDIYLNDNIAAPLYRLPIVAWENAYPVLLASGVLKREHVETLHKFYNAVETFNRGLDQVEVARGDEDKLVDEAARLLLKANAISTKSDLYLKALNALNLVG